MKVKIMDVNSNDGDIAEKAIRTALEYLTPILEKQVKVVKQYPKYGCEIYLVIRKHDEDN